MNSTAPTTAPATDPVMEMLAAAADAYEAGKAVRRNAARTAQAAGKTYREIGEGLRIGTTQAFNLGSEAAA